jgi:hypothetical protein
LTWLQNIRLIFLNLSWLLQQIVKMKKKEHMNCFFKNILNVVETTLALILVSHVIMKNIMTTYIISNFHFFEFLNTSILCYQLLEVQLIVQPHHAKRMQCAMVHVSWNYFKTDPLVIKCILRGNFLKKVPYW